MQSSLFASPVNGGGRRSSSSGGWRTKFFRIPDLRHIRQSRLTNVLHPRPPPTKEEGIQDTGCRGHPPRRCRCRRRCGTHRGFHYNQVPHASLRCAPSRPEPLRDFRLHPQPVSLPRHLRAPLRRLVHRARAGSLSVRLHQRPGRRPRGFSRRPRHPSCWRRQPTARRVHGRAVVVVPRRHGASAPAPDAAACLSWRADERVCRYDAHGGRQCDRVLASWAALPDSSANARDHVRNDHPRRIRIPERCGRRGAARPDEAIVRSVFEPPRHAVLSARDANRRRPMESVGARRQADASDRFDPLRGIRAAAKRRRRGTRGRPLDAAGGALRRRDSRSPTRSFATRCTLSC